MPVVGPGANRGEYPFVLPGISRSSFFTISCFVGRWKIMAGRIPGPVRTLQRSWACRRAAVSGTVVKKAGLPAVFEELFSSLFVVAAQLVADGPRASFEQVQPRARSTDERFQH